MDLENIKVWMKKACAQFLKMFYFLVCKSSRKPKNLLKLNVYWVPCYVFIASIWVNLWLYLKEISTQTWHTEAAGLE